MAVKTLSRRVCYSPHQASKSRKVSERSKLWGLIVRDSVVMILHDEFSKVIFVKKQSFIYILNIEGYAA
jgi:hypothetical protein